ncbi:MAG: glycosyltransferase [Candidatus Cloacimonetes bacterium]|nr:glycosyltransferase [Candidatus Cloacimonadota bacterium]
MSKPRVLLVSMTLGAGGAERNIVHLADWFCRTCQTGILTLSPVEEDHYFVPVGVTRLVGKLNKSRLPKITPRFLKVLINFFYLRARVKEFSPDICICFVDEMNLLLLLALAGTGIPVIISERIHPAYHSIHRILNCLRPLIYKMCVKLVVQTEAIAHWCQINWSLPASQISIIPNPVLPVSQKVYQTIPRAYCIGRMDLQKNHSLLLEMFASQNAPEIATCLIGSGVLKSHLLEQINTLVLPITVMEPVQDIKELLHPGNILIHCSLYEGFPNVVLEAMSCGAVPVCTPFPGVESIVNHGVDGLIADSFSALAMNTCVQALISDPVLREKLSQNAIATAQRHHPDKIMPRWTELVETYRNK